MVTAIAAAPSGRHGIGGLWPDVFTAIAQLEPLMADTKCKYRSGDEAEALQARYRQLMETRDGGTPAEAVALATRDYGMSEADASVSWATAQRIEQALPAARCGPRSTPPSSSFPTRSGAPS